MKKKNNNKGFSLLELLVAVAILAVVVTPFLMTFVTTTDLNRKTKTRQNAKYAATNVMEDIRSVDAAEIVAAAKSSDSVAGDEQTGGNESDEAHQFESGGNTYDVYDNGDGSYFCTTTYTVTPESGNVEEYTVDAVIDPNVHEDESKEATSYNQVEMANIRAMGSAYDALYEVGGTLDDEKMDQLAEKQFGSRDDDILRQIYKSVNREITITISEGDSENHTGSKVVVSSVYSTPSYPEGVTTRSEVYDSTLKEVKNIYLFYNPFYNGTSRQARETITVVNEAGVKCDVFLIKQEWPDSVQEYNTFTYSRYCSYPDKSTRNNNYLVNLRLKQNWSANDFNNDGALTTIRTDLKDYNIKATYCHSAGGNNYSTTVGESLSAADIMGLTDLSGKKKTEFIYKVTVKAYEGKFEGRERDENKVKCELSATTQ